MVCCHASETLPKIVYGYLAQSWANIDFQFLHLNTKLPMQDVYAPTSQSSNHQMGPWPEQGCRHQNSGFIDTIGRSNYTRNHIAACSACGSVHNFSRVQTTILKLFPVSYQYTTWWPLILDSIVPFGQGKGPGWRPSQNKGLMIMWQSSAASPRPLVAQ